MVKKVVFRGRLIKWKHCKTSNIITYGIIHHGGFQNGRHMTLWMATSIHAQLCTPAYRMYKYLADKKWNALAV